MNGVKKMKWLSRLLGRRSTEPAKAAQRPVIVGGGRAAPLFDDAVSLEHAREQLAHNAGWVFTAVRIIAQRIAGQPLMVGRRVRGRKVQGAKNLPTWIKQAGQVEVLQDHELIRALADPNEFQVAATLLLSTVGAMELTGRSYWFLDRVSDPGRLQIWPLPPHWVKPIHEGRPFARYEVRPRGSFQPVMIPAELVIRFYYPDPADPLGSLSPLQAAARAVVADESLQTAQGQGFANGIWPGLGVFIGQFPGAGLPGTDQQVVLDEDQREQVIQWIKRAYGGVLRYNEPLIIDGLIRDVKELTRSNKEMDFLNSGKQTKSRILQAFGVNAILAGELENANRASAAVADDNFCAVTINPKIELLSQCLTSWYSAFFNDPDLIVWIEHARARDSEARRLELDLAATFGVITVNELRGELGFDPLKEGGDVLISPRPAGNGTGSQNGQGGPATGRGYFRQHERNGSGRLPASLGQAPSEGRN